MQRTSPGGDFYYERLARARALPEAERSADVRQWLRQHEELEAALAALPELPASATSEHPLVEPLGGDVALAALLRFIAAAFSDSAADLLHPEGTLGHLAPQLPPFYGVCLAPGDKARATAGGSFSHHTSLSHVCAACLRGPCTC